MAFAKKDAVIAQLFGAPGALVDLVDVFDAAVDAMQAEFHKEFNRKELSAAQPQPKLGLSRAKTQRPQRSENNGEKILQDNSSLPSELGVLCAPSIKLRTCLAGVNSPYSSIPDTGKFARAAQTFKHSSTVFISLVNEDGPDLFRCIRLSVPLPVKRKALRTFQSPQLCWLPWTAPYGFFHLGGSESPFRRVTQSVR